MVATKSKKAVSSPKKKSRLQTSFVLENINFTSILTKMGYIKPRKKRAAKSIPQPLTDEDKTVNELMHTNSKMGKRAVYYFDATKTRVKFWPIMIDITQGGALPLQSSTKCWRCFEAFDTAPIGCPIKYNGEKTGVLRERIVEVLKAANLDTTTTDFFETEGMFCSLPCVKAYILIKLSMCKSGKYRESLTLLTLMCIKILGEAVVIPPSGTWKVLIPFGGHLTSEEYRETFGRLEYSETVNCRRPYMYSTSAYISEKKLKLL